MPWSTLSGSHEEAFDCPMNEAFGLSPPQATAPRRPGYG